MAAQVMSGQGIYCIHILDPDDRKAIITSIDRIYASSKKEAERIFKETFPWRSNWLVKAKPTWNEESTQHDQKTNYQKAGRKEIGQCSQKACS